MAYNNGLPISDIAFFERTYEHRQAYTTYNLVRYVRKHFTALYITSRRIQKEGRGSMVNNDSKDNNATPIPNKPIGTVILRNKPNINLIAKSVMIAFKNGTTVKK